MNRLTLLTPDQSSEATKGDIVVDADSRTLHIKISDCDCRTPCPSGWSSSIHNCCWLSLRHLDMLMQLEDRLKTGGVSLREHPDITDLRIRLINLESDQYQRQSMNRLDEELQQLKQQYNEQMALIQRLLPSTVATIEDGERKLQLQPQQ